MLLWTSAWRQQNGSFAFDPSARNISQCFVLPPMGDWRLLSLQGAPAKAVGSVSGRDSPVRGMCPPHVPLPVAYAPTRMP